MKQIFILGASSVYGVGAEHDGWGDLVKSYVHSRMYGPGGIGEAYEVLNFSKSGSTIDFVIKTLPWLVKNYARSNDPNDLIILLSVGGNDAKASGSANAFISTPETFEDNLISLRDTLLQYSKHIIFVSNGYVAESKVNPKPVPFEGKISYFTNKRRMMFNDITRKVCLASNIEFVSVECDKDTWIKQYLYDDGLHPNQAGYDLVFHTLRPLLDNHL
jgi:lysophospholipase L1-like esterase